MADRDPRIEPVVRLVAAVDGAARRLARVATTAAAVGGTAGLLLWWMSAGHRITEAWEGTVASVVVLVVCLAPAGWLLNVRVALHSLVELPEKLGGVASRRAAELRGESPEPPPRNLWQTVRAVRGVVRDYGEVVGSWGTVAQLLVPSFWLLTGLALAAVGVLVLAAAVAGLLA